MRLQIIGNCQARPLAAMLSSLPNVTCLEPIVLQLAQVEEREIHEKNISEADYIIAQMTHSSFRLPYLQEKHLREQYGSRVIVWPNIFFAGQQPFLKYLTHEEHGRLMGPMDAMHDLRLWKGWLETGLVDPDMIESQVFLDNCAISHKSISALRGREENCDVIISDIIEYASLEETLFFTFNHPAQKLLRTLAERVAEKIGKSSNQLIFEDKEPLGRYVVPSTWSNKSSKFQGDSFEIGDGGRAIRLPGAPVPYSLEELCQAYQSCYDTFDAFREKDRIRLTPDYSKS